jgi:hypothetical protein
MPFHAGFAGGAAVSQPMLVPPEPRYDVCAKNYDVCGHKTWFTCLTMIEDDL